MCQARISEMTGRLCVIRFSRNNSFDYPFFSLRPLVESMARCGGSVNSAQPRHTGNKQKKDSQMKTTTLMASALTVATTAFGGIWFKGDATMRQGYWDDLNCWWTWYTYANHATSLSSITDVNIPYGHTVVVTGTTAKCYSLKAFPTKPIIRQRCASLPAGR